MATIKSSNINITDLDFDEVESSLKEYLKGQTILKDYDFEGSNLSILVDLLAYSAHTLAFNANMVASEMFLDTAQIRKNVVSRAKELGYTPSSRTAAKATFDLTVNNPLVSGSTPTNLTISRGHEFTTVFDGTSYTTTGTWRLSAFQKTKAVGGKAGGLPHKQTPSTEKQEKVTLRIMEVLLYF